MRILLFSFGGALYGVGRWFPVVRGSFARIVGACLGLLSNFGSVLGSEIIKP